MEHLIITADGKLEAESWLNLTSDEQDHEIEAVLQEKASWRPLIELLVNGFLY